MTDVVVTDVNVAVVASLVWQWSWDGLLGLGWLDKNWDGPNGSLGSGQLGKDRDGPRWFLDPTSWWWLIVACGYDGQLHPSPHPAPHAVDDLVGWPSLASTLPAVAATALDNVASFPPPPPTQLILLVGPPLRVPRGGSCKNNGRHFNYAPSCGR